MTQPHFVHEVLAGRIVFGRGSLDTLPAEAERLGISRPMILSTAQQRASAEAIVNMFGRSRAGLFDGARMHTPVETTEAAMAATARHAADGLIAIGGGSTTGLGKAIALRTNLPQIVLPTTYAGSEVTPILGETRDGIKVTQRGAAILPETVIYDPDLTLSLPISLSVSSGFNAIAHAAEALYAQDRSPIIALMAEESVRALVSALPRIVAEPSGFPGRNDALYGAWLAGTCLGSVGMALHHKLCHVLGGSFDLPHAETHTAVLPYSLAYNLVSASDAAMRLSRVMGSSDPALALQSLARSLGAAVALRDLSMPEEGLDRAADLAMSAPYWNPRPITREAIRKLLEQAWRGVAPSSD